MLSTNEPAFHMTNADEKSSKPSRTHTLESKNHMRERASASPTPAQAPTCGPRTRAPGETASRLHHARSNDETVWFQEGASALWVTDAAKPSSAATCCRQCPAQQAGAANVGLAGAHEQKVLLLQRRHAPQPHRPQHGGDHRCSRGFDVVIECRHALHRHQHHCCARTCQRWNLLQVPLSAGP